MFHRGASLIALLLGVAFVHSVGEVLADEVPLSLWTDASHPTGLDLGAANGLSWGDYDADGYVDLFACQSGNLWKNIGGTTWVLAANLADLLPPATLRYGSSFGDYDNDGLPDIATAPRKDGDGDLELHLLKNLGGGPLFVDVASDPVIVDTQPFGDSETLCWGDVDSDFDLDLFVPVYPQWAIAGQPGNFFLSNLGPSGPFGAYRFAEQSATAGLDNPPGTDRPEGAQVVDVDFDGDLDLYSNGTLYRNISAPGAPAFEPMAALASGIGLAGSIDEGALFFDYDLDSDYDLLAVYTTEGVRIWESYGDGMFYAPQGPIVEQPLQGLGLGMSAEDWDNDGDIDLTTRHVFRLNRLIEDGARGFSVATHSIPADHVVNATPAWGDWDHDGDLDCALGNFTDNGQHGVFHSHFYENTVYSPATPAGERRYVRVRPVGNSATMAAGLENQYGASAEITVLSPADTFRRRKFTASSHGYLNQNEYALHFAVPDDPAPGDPEEDVRFDLKLDFPGLPTAGLWRVDKHVNPLLGDLNLAELDDREVRVYRCGEVVINGVLHAPPPLASPFLVTTTDGLALPTATEPLAAPTLAPPDTFVGLSFDTLNASDRLRVKEIVLDGQLGLAASCGTPGFNMALWDVTEAAAPFIVDGGALAEASSPRNRRSYFDVDVVLERGRLYRLVARVTAYRATVIDAPIDHGPLRVRGGLLYQSASPCDGDDVAAAVESTTATSLALRFDPSGVASEEPDPIAESLLVDKSGELAALQWPGLPGAASYEVLRCDATAGPCVPAPYGSTERNAYVDADGKTGHVWYLVRAVGACAATARP